MRWPISEDDIHTTWPTGEDYACIHVFLKRRLHPYPAKCGGAYGRDMKQYNMWRYILFAEEERPCFKLRA
jgi:hypothetical protein